MNLSHFKSLAAATVLFLLMCRLGISQEEPERYPIPGVKEKGVVFNIAQDRQIVGIGGVHQPEGLDIYLKRHIDRLYTQLEAVQGDVNDLRTDIQEIKRLLQTQSTVESNP